MTSDSVPKQASCLKTVLAWTLLLGIFGLTAIAFATHHYGWQIYLELLSHFQLQYFTLCGISLLVLALLRRKRLFLLGLVCTAILGTQITTWYWPPKFLNSGEGSNFRILVANINTQNQRYEDVLAFVRQEEPDLALFMEVDTTWIDQLNTLSDFLPHSFGEGSPYHFGIMLYSRYSFETVQRVAFGDDRIPSLIGEVSFNNQTLSFVGTHPPPPIRPSIFQSRNRQLDLVGQHLQTMESPKLLMGDLNLSMWSPYYGRLVRQTGLKNARKGFGILPSWPTYGAYPQIPGWANWLFAIPIDHCLLSSDLEVVKVQTGPNLGSDHRPVIIDLKF
ncbi:MAG: endonuclease/exonuclease/phosphatase family protein [Cyanobacteria bacterium J06639_14]